VLDEWPVGPKIPFQPALQPSFPSATNTIIITAPPKCQWTFYSPSRASYQSRK
jgi:hypothetical protein